jgi:hypothetical protein
LLGRPRELVVLTSRGRRLLMLLLLPSVSCRGYS